MAQDPAVYSKTHMGRPALVFGNGWRLNRMLAWAVLPFVVTVGVNRSWEIVDSMYHATIDPEGDAPPEYKGVRFGSIKNPHPDVIKAYWSTYWIENAQLTKPVSPVLSGLFAIEVAAFLGCAPIYLVGFDGDNPGEGHFYPGKPASLRMSIRQNDWLRRVCERREIVGLVFAGDRPALTVTRSVEAAESGILGRVA